MLLRDASDRSIIIAVPKCDCISDVLRALDVKVNSYNRKMCLERIESLELDISHFISRYSTKKDSQEKVRAAYERGGPPVSLYHLKQFMIAVGDSKCSKCRADSWLDGPLPLKLFFWNGNKNNQEKTNALLVCPNCFEVLSQKHHKAGVVGLSKYSKPRLAPYEAPF